MQGADWRRSLQDDQGRTGRLCPHGFDVELASFILPQWDSAVQNYLIAVGIRAKLNQLQVGR